MPPEMLPRLMELSDGTPVALLHHRAGIDCHWRPLEECPCLGKLIVIRDLRRNRTKTSSSASRCRGRLVQAILKRWGHVPLMESRRRIFRIRAVDLLKPIQARNCAESCRRQLAQ
jgi:hypothetical protein